MARGWGRRLRAHLTQLCACASVPGLRYLTEPRRPRVERLLWVLCFAAALTACGWLVSKTWARWRDSPVIVAMSKSQRSVWDVPFPAVTICPLSKIMATAFNYTDAAKRYLTDQLTEEELTILEILSHQCEIGIPSSEYPSDVVLAVMEQVSPAAAQCTFPFHWESSTLAHFRDLKLPEGAWQPLLTDEGICFSFNMLPADQMFPPDTVHGARSYLKYEEQVHWSLDGGYSAQADTAAYPRRSLEPGETGGMYLTTGIKLRYLEHVCMRSVRGFKVHLHSPADFPRVSRRAFLAALDTAVHVSVTPRETRTDASLRARYSPQQRRCFFLGERPLRFFRQYTQSNCQLECLANATRQLCGCVAFYMPRELNVSICKKPSSCVSYASRKMQMAESGIRDDRAIAPGDTAPSLASACGCLPACEALDYTVERSAANFDLEKLQQMINHKKSEFPVAGVQLNIFFRDTNYLPMRRMELYGVVDMIANCGGLLGLCLGASVLSLLELLYWLLVRPWAGPGHQPGPSARVQPKPQPAPPPGLTHAYQHPYQLSAASLGYYPPLGVRYRAYAHPA